MSDYESETESSREVVPLTEVEFEGEFVTKMEGKLPQLMLHMNGGYPRGTHLRLEVEVRVKGVVYHETKADFVRQHSLVVESIALRSAYDPATAADTVGGSASGQALPSAEDADELGLKFGRTSDQWQSGPSVIV